jgi:hypothetical protein
MRSGVVYERGKVPNKNRFQTQRTGMAERCITTCKAAEMLYRQGQEAYVTKLVNISEPEIHLNVI